MISRHKHPADVPVRLQLSKPYWPPCLLGHHREVANEPGRPAGCVDVVRSPGMDLVQVVVPGVDSPDRVSEEDQQGRRIVRLVWPQRHHSRDLRRLTTLFLLAWPLL